MVRRAQTVIAIVTGNRVGHRALTHVCPITDVRRIITDATADETVLAEFRALGIRVDVIDTPA